MTSDGTGPSRRQVLEGTAVGLSAIGGYVAFAPESERVTYNVGYRRGRRSAVFGLVDHVLREYPFGAATVELTRQSGLDLRDELGVRYVERNGELRAIDPIEVSDATPPTTTEQCLPWGIDRVDADVAHEDGATGEGVDVAIVDTGIDPTHPDLTGNLGDGEAIVSCGRGCEEPWGDDAGHGTHCAGIVAADDTGRGVRGVAPEATLHAVKVLDGNGRGTFGDIAAGIEAVADRDWDVASMSLGGNRSRLVRDAVQYAHENGVVLVGAAGNRGPCDDCVGYPAAEEEVIAVSATSDDDTLAEFSSTGPEVELAAPGEAVYSTVPDGGHERLSGTSMACPHVSGAVAQVLAAGSDPGEARELLGETAEDIGLSDAESGAGLLDVAAALDLDSSDDGTGNC